MHLLGLFGEPLLLLTLLLLLALLWLFRGPAAAVAAAVVAAVALLLLGASRLVDLLPVCLVVLSAPSPLALAVVLLGRGVVRGGAVLRRPDVEQSIVRLTETREELFSEVLAWLVN